MITPTKEPIYINSFQSYKLYLILANQFRKGYDPIKYSWKIKVNPATFEKRPDKQFFDRISKNFNIHQQQELFMVNLLANPDQWIGELASADQVQFYRKYISRFNDLQILFKEDITNLILLCKQRNIQFKELFQFTKNNELPIFKLLQREAISYETFILLDSYFNFINELDKLQDFIWEQFQVRVKAYKLFFEVNQQEVIDILKEQLKLWK